MNTVLSIMNMISAVSSKKAKKDIVAANKDNPLFYKVVKYALDQNKTYGITELPETSEKNGHKYGLFEYLDHLASKRGASNEEALLLASIANAYGSAGREVVNKILQKKLRIGCDASTFNDVVPGWVYEVPYQRFSSFSAINNIDFQNDNVIVQIKYDGQFSYLMPDDSFLSRNGSSFELKVALCGSNEWISKVGKDLVWMGELLVLDKNGLFLPRKTGNGIINSFISGEGDTDNADKIRYVTWGYITKDDFDRGYSDMTYEEMIESIIPFASPGSKILFSRSEKVGSAEDALDLYAKYRSRKEEGAMIKVINKLRWKDESSGSKFGVKLKPVCEGEFEIVEAYYGDKKGKYADFLGGLVVKSSCGNLLTKLGGGFSDEERTRGVDWWNGHKGDIVTGKFTGITTDKTDRKTYCLDHGRFVETRFHDKTSADTLEYLMEQVKKG